MILIGVDFGFQRIGLALTDTEVGLPRPLMTLAAKGSLKKDAAAIAEIAAKETASTIVLGLPVEPSGDEGRMARICRQLASEIEGHGLVVHLVDESMSSINTEQSMIEAGMKAALRKRKIDAGAAALILERYLRGCS